MGLIGPIAIRPCQVDTLVVGRRVAQAVKQVAAAQSRRNSLLAGAFLHLKRPVGGDDQPTPAVENEFSTPREARTTPG